MPPKKSNILEAKIVLIGNTGVGKSSILRRFIANTFRDDEKATIGAAFMDKEITVADQRISFNIWDTAGQERY